MLFVYLLFETTKLSREKIRQQFAIDSAAFIQMGDYTNILNRTAYVNGAFPYRIFKELYDCPAGCSSTGQENCLEHTRQDGFICKYKMVYDAGAIPRYTGDVEYSEPVPLDNKSKWDIPFNDVRDGINKNPPQVGGTLELITHEQAVKYGIFESPAQALYKWYYQVYYMLGAVEESQMTVFERLTENFTFFRKSYYLNANTDECLSNANLCGNDGVRSRGGFWENKFGNHGYDSSGTNMTMWHVKAMILEYKVPKPGEIPPYYIGRTPPQDMPGHGLFQLATFKAGTMDKVGKGYNVYQGWNMPTNYFGSAARSQILNKVACQDTPGRPCVHALVASQCPQLSSGNNCVWPNPTPKYQTRLYP